jgi:L-2,4-diaminobutyrate decarboxylase
VSTALTPAELEARFAEPLPDDGRPIADVIDRLRRDVLPDCNRLTHPRSMGHQVSAPLPVAVWTETVCPEQPCHEGHAFRTRIGVEVRTV